MKQHANNDRFGAMLVCRLVESFSTVGVRLQSIIPKSTSIARLTKWCFDKMRNTQILFPPADGLLSPQCFNLSAIYQR